MRVNLTPYDDKESKVIIRCENCEQKLRIRPSQSVQRITCPRCHHEFSYELREGTFVTATEDYALTSKDKRQEIPPVQEIQDTSILYWPRPPDGGYDVVSLFFMILFYPVGIGVFIYNQFFGGFEKRRKRDEIREQHRSRTIQITNSALITPAKYVGGHPLIPQSQKVVLSLNKTHFTVFSIDEDYRINPLTSISLLDILKAARGKPKTAREIYDEDHGHTIDVMEHSPFLSIVFKLEGHSYMASFEDFDESSPLEWSNQIIALQYHLMQEKKIPSESSS